MPLPKRNPPAPAPTTAAAAAAAPVVDDPFAPTPWNAIQQKRAVAQAQAQAQAQGHHNSRHGKVTVSGSNNSNKNGNAGGNVSSRSQMQQRRGAMIAGSPSMGGGGNNNGNAVRSSAATSLNNPLNASSHHSAGGGAGASGGGGVLNSSNASYHRSMNASSSNSGGGGGGNSSRHSSSGVIPSVPADIAKREEERKKAKERFLMFTKVLMKYLETRDPQLHSRAKLVIKECAERNKAKDPNYKSLTAAMQTRLRDCVGEFYWKKADDYLNHFLKTKKKELEVKQKERAAALKRQEMERLRLQKQKQSSSSAVPSPLVGQTTKPTSKQSTSTSGSKSSSSSSSMKNQSSKVQGTSGRATPITTGNKTSKAKASSSNRGNNNASSSSTSKQSSSNNAKQQVGSSKGTKADNNSGSSKSAPSVDLQKIDLPPDIVAMLEQNVRYDPFSAAKLLSRENLAERLNLDREQKILLYGITSFTSRQSKLRIPRRTCDEVPNKTNANVLQPVLFKGWDQRNIVNTRIAYSKVHCSSRAKQQPENKRIQDEDENAHVMKADEENHCDTIFGSVDQQEWINEEVAENNPMLTLISEAVQLFTKRILEKAVTFSRKKQNLDAIRLWHLHHLGIPNHNKPPLGLQLGCDVQRQHALADAEAGNACYRMEQALSRRAIGIVDTEDLDSEDVISKATNLSDLARRVKLPNGANDAEVFTKKRLQQYDGRSDMITEPPFGRVPKRCKVVPDDLIRAYNTIKFS